MNKLWKPALFLVAIAVMVFGVLSSGAWFTDTATGTTGAISSGTLSIEDGKLSEVTLGTITDMAPGDKTGNAVIIIKNNGTIPLAWFGDLVVSDSYLKDAIYIDYAQMEFLSPTGQNWQAQGPDNFITNGVGSGPYPTYYNYLVSLSTFGVITLNNFDGSDPMGVTPYEFMGALKPGYSYKLTLRFGFAEGAGNDYQGRGPLNLSFKVDATQVNADALNAHHTNFGTYHFTWLSNQILDQTEN